MYHEVSQDAPETRGRRHMSPVYDMAVSVFDEQMRVLSERRYRGLLLHDVATQGGERDPAVLLTFDDGLAGNERNALPILKKYGLRATFFVAVGSIGTARFMDWEQLKTLVREGMSVQSHTVNHRPLQLLGEREMYRELYESKARLEDELGIEVNALSFPHGSYDARAVDTACQLGYRYLCTSDASYNDIAVFRSTPAVLSRLAVARNTKTAQFVKWIECDTAAAFKVRLIKDSRNLAKRLIGINNYRRLYRRYFGIKSDGA